MFRAIGPGVCLGAISRQMVAEYKAKRLDYRAAATVARELAVLKRLLKVAMEWGKVRTDPTVMVENSQ
jgi:hypothetical protein